MVHQFGRHHDTADYRDWPLPKTFATMRVPPLVDLSEWTGPRKDQGNSSSCTGNAGANDVELISRKYLKSAPILSPNSLYVGELQLEGSFPQDIGAIPRSICKVLSTQGVCEESLEPYVAGKLVVPTPAQLANALKYKMGGFHRLAGLPDFLLCLGDPTPWPVLVGFDCYKFFESDEMAATGILQMPKPGETPLGGHEVLAVGYDLSKDVAVCENSYGPEWGMETGRSLTGKGFFTMPLDFLANANYVSDLWIVHPGVWGPPKMSPPK